MIKGESDKYYIYELSGYKDGKSKNLKLSLLNPIKKNQAYLVKWEERRSIVSKIEETSKSKFEKIRIHKHYGRKHSLFKRYNE
ncbi:DUF1093 domain-containing protein [Bacillus sp. SL00103]